eukprot:1808094-Rhodomonas_salina.3
MAWIAGLGQVPEHAVGAARRDAVPAPSRQPRANHTKHSRCSERRAAKGSGTSRPATGWKAGGKRRGGPGRGRKG